MTIRPLWSTLPSAMSRPLSFQKWRELFRNDCVARNKQLAFDKLGVYVLKVLYENGLDPTVEAVSENGLDGQQKGRATRP